MNRNQIFRLSGVSLILLSGFALSPSSAGAQKTPPRTAPISTQEKIDPANLPIVEASKLLTNSKAFMNALQPEATLDDKVKALEDKSVLKALDMAKSWLKQPATPPAIIEESLGASSEYTDFRQVSRGLSLESYVLLSEGRVKDALFVVEQNLKIAAPLYRRSLIGGLVGLACEAIAVRPLGRNLASISLKEVDYLSKIAKDWLSDDATLTMLENEQKSQLLSLRSTVKNSLLEKPVSAPPPDEKIIFLKEENERQEALRQQLKSMTEPQREALLQKVEAQTNLEFVRIKELTKQSYSRWIGEISKEDVLPPGASLLETERVRSAEINRVTLIMLVKRKAMGKLLATHAAVIKFRWENGKLPVTLEELKLGDIAVDPYTDALLLYKVTGREYTLASAGAMEYDAQQHLDPTKRKSINLMFSNTSTEKSAPSPKP